MWFTTTIKFAKTDVETPRMENFAWMNMRGRNFSVMSTEKVSMSTRFKMSVCLNGQRDRTTHMSRLFAMKFSHDKDLKPIATK